MRRPFPIFAAIDILILALSFTLRAGAQVITSAPVVWERYKISDPNVSVLLPKLPTVVRKEGVCSEFRSASYFAYAENAVYELSVTAKNKNPIPRGCANKKQFGDNTLFERVAALRGNGTETTETTLTTDGVLGYKFVLTDEARWIFPHMDKDFWVELALVKRPDAKVDEERFIGSLDPAGGSGKEIKDGSPVTLGDDGVPPGTIQEGPQNLKDAKNYEPFRVVSKPKAAYTESARRANVQGFVRLKIVFLASGGIGNVTVLRELPEGLTEQAIAAAKKVSFLPKRVNGVPVSTAVTFEYGFNLY